MFLIGGGIPISALELLDVSSERVYFPLSADYHGFGECNLGFFQPPSQQWHFSWVYKHPHLKIFHNPGEKLATWAGGTRFPQVPTGPTNPERFMVWGLGPTQAAIFVVFVPPRVGCNLSAN